MATEFLMGLLSFYFPSTSLSFETASVFFSYPHFLESSLTPFLRSCFLLVADFGVSAKNNKTLQRRDSFIGTPYW